MLPVEDYLAEVLAIAHPIAPVMLGLEEAEGGVLAADATARSPLPSFDNSSMDGYAVQAADVVAATAAAPVFLPVASQIPAGDTSPHVLRVGTCARLMTGAPLPAGADAVVPVEWTDGGRDRVAISQPAAPGHAIRRRGDDVAEGQLMGPAGALLGPSQIALLAAGGHREAMVRPRPQVAVIATGNELTEPGSPLVPGRIWDSNSYLLAAAVRQAGGVAQRHRVKDDPDAVVAALDELSASADLLVTSGGISMGGEHDVVKAALAGHAEVAFRKVAMQPGMPQGFGVVGRSRTPLFTLPGNPVSAFVSFQLFVQPAMAARQGRALAPPPLSPAVLTVSVRSPAQRRSYLRGVLDHAAGTVTPLPGQGSHQLGALALANALIVVPEQVTSMQAGDTADVMSLP